MTRIRNCVQVLGFLILYLLTACTGIPKAELSVYTESFNAVRSASEAILVDYAAAQKENVTIEATIAAREEAKQSSIPATFDPHAALAFDGTDANVVARLQVLETITRYNGVLVALAEGKSVEEVKGRFNALTGSLTTLLSTFGTVVPVLSLATPIVETFLELAEMARTREAFKKAIKEGEPIIRMIIDKGLIADTQDFYGVRRTLAERESRRVRRAGLESAMTVTKIAAEHLEPASGSSLETSKQVAQQKLAAALELLDHKDTEVTVTGGVKRKLSNLTGLPAGTADAPAYTELVQVRMNQLVESTESAASKYQKVISDTKTYWELLSAYVKLLNQTKAILENVRVQLDAPPNIEAMARQLALTAIKLRGAFEAFRGSRE